MPDIFTKIEIPNFLPAYDSEIRYGFKNTNYKKNLKELLNNTSNGFCMYCYVRIEIDGKLLGHLEHSIEKSNSKYLIECVPNISWVCPVCNDIFKKSGESERMLSKKDVRIFERNLHCNANNCKKECVKYKNLKKKYVSKDNAHIILQPSGMKGFDTGYDLRIQYNVQNAQFEPSVYQGQYSEEEKRYIIDHINKFHLNDEKYKTNALMTFFEDVIEADGHMIRTPENNIVVTIFKKKLEGLGREQILKICKKLYLYYTVKKKESKVEY